MLAVALGLMVAPPAGARDITSLDGPELARILQDAGYRATVGVDAVGDPMVTSTASGSDFSVFMYDCDAGRCGSIQFKAGFDLDPGTTTDAMNAWNEGMRYTNAYMDDEGDPWLELDLDLAEGSTDTQVVGYLQLWDTLMGQFQDHIGF